MPDERCAVWQGQLHRSQGFVPLRQGHLGVGEYIEKIFPFMGVRFIAINDNYDSLHSNVESDELIIPFKNLIKRGILPGYLDQDSEPA